MAISCHLIIYEKLSEDVNESKIDHDKIQQDVMITMLRLRITQIKQIITITLKNIFVLLFLLSVIAIAPQCRVDPIRLHPPLYQKKKKK
jgi:hypothetical protein